MLRTYVTNLHKWRMRPSLQALHDGNLTEPRQAHLLQHLQSCNICRETLKAWEELDHRLARACPQPEPLSEDRSAALFERALKQANTKVRPAMNRRATTALTVACTLACALSLRLIFAPSAPTRHPGDSFFGPVRNVRTPQIALSNLSSDAIAKTNYNAKSSRLILSPLQVERAAKSKTLPDHRRSIASTFRKPGTIAPTPGKNTELALNTSNRLTETIENGFALKSSVSSAPGKLSPSTSNQPALPNLMAGQEAPLSITQMGRKEANALSKKRAAPTGLNQLLPPSVASQHKEVKLAYIEPQQKSSASDSNQVAPYGRKLLRGKPDANAVASTHARDARPMSGRDISPMAATLSASPSLRFDRALADSSNDSKESTYSSMSLAEKSRPASVPVGERLIVSVSRVPAAVILNTTRPTQNTKIMAPTPAYVEMSLAQNDSRFAPLVHLVDVQLKDATVKQAADAISKASGVTISVDKAVPTDLRLNIEAQNVPMATVLEVIGNQAELTIAPEQNKNDVTAGASHEKSTAAPASVAAIAVPEITLKPWPSITVNNMKYYYKSGNAPWSSEWISRLDARGSGGGGLGGGSAGFGGGFGRARGDRLGQANSEDAKRDAGFRIDVDRAVSQAKGSNTLSVSGGFPGTSPPGRSAKAVENHPTEFATSKNIQSAATGLQLSEAEQNYRNGSQITRLSDTSFVLVEPVTTPHDSGILLTIYKLKGRQLLKVTSTYHPTPRAGKKKP